MHELDDVADSCGGEISKEQFIKVYEYAIGDGKNHEFLFIDLHKKPEHPSQFRRYLNQFIMVDELVDKDIKENRIE